MSFPRQIFEFMKAASIAHAKWDYEVSMSIIKNRKKLLVLFLLLLPILAISFSEAADVLGAKRRMPLHFIRPQYSWFQLQSVWLPGLSQDVSVRVAGLSSPRPLWPLG